MPGIERFIKHAPLSYADRLERRSLDDIDLVVLHCTELPDMKVAREFGERIHYEDSRTGNSGHFYISREGRLESWVDPERVAHHTRGYNERSVGIELSNRGRWPDWFHSEKQVMTEPYPAAQIAALEWLLNELLERLGRLRWIAGHEQLDTEMVPATDSPDDKVFRKRDPGPMFPWKQLLASTSLKPLTPGGQ